MFKRVRNRILLLNMVMVSAVVIVAFAVIFGITYTRVQNENISKLMYSARPSTLVSDRPFFERTDTIYAAPSAGVVGGEMGATPDVSMSVVTGYARRISPGEGLSFSMLVDSQINVVDVNSMLDMPDVLYTRAASEVMTARRGATIELGGHTWQYAVYPVTVLFTEDMGATLSVSGEFNNIRFLDVTDSHRMLRTLAIMLISLTVAILVVFYFISRIFANRAIRPMEEAWEMQSRFVADASHELKTPLSIINADCGVLYAGGGETVDSQIKWVDSIMRASGRMTELIGGMLSLARMEDAQTEIAKAPFCLSETVEEAVSEMEAAAARKGITIESRIEPDIEIENDRERVWQILTILLDNAVKYADDGGEAAVTLKREKRCVICTVRNSGGGIPREELPRVFDRFYRGDPARSSENGGYGLGLSIAKAAADRIGARLTVGSETGEYTEFSLRINTSS